MHEVSSDCPREGQWTIEARLGPYQAQMNRALVELAREDVLPRIWAHDHTVWKPQPDEITNRLGWLHIASLMEADLPRLEASARAVWEEGYRQALVLGMGGSSLAPALYGKVFAPQGRAGLELGVLDSTDPGAVLAQLERLDLQRTLFIVSTKSGTTVETLSLFRFFYGQVLALKGPDRAGEQFVAVTDPGTWLAGEAQRLRFRSIFLGEPTIGGRYSALSVFGLLPAALAGLDLSRLLAEALSAMEACGPHVPADSNPAAFLGCILGGLALAGRDKVTFVLPQPLAPFGDWAEQLLAESTGKEGKAIVPVVGEPLGPPEVYSDDRLFVWVGGAPDASTRAALAALEQAGHPLVWVGLRDEYALGGAFFLWELATAVAGSRLGVNPFDQPDVESAKHLARQALAAAKEHGAAVGPVAEPATAWDLGALRECVRPGDYVALLAYLPPLAEVTARLQALRVALRDRFKVATTLGFGPRYLHSTGQMHKGDRGNGVFIQFTADPERDVPIPDAAGGAAATLTFGQLEAAQAEGDRRALAQAGRRLWRVHLGSDPVSALAEIAAVLGDRGGAG
jgi:transaldolase/glucose-6-phosphate isomerase